MTETKITLQLTKTKLEKIQLEEYKKKYFYLFRERFPLFMRMCEDDIALRILLAGKDVYFRFACKIPFYYPPNDDPYYYDENIDSSNVEYQTDDENQTDNDLCDEDEFNPMPKLVDSIYDRTWMLDIKFRNHVIAHTRAALKDSKTENIYSEYLKLSLKNKIRIRKEVETLSHKRDREYFYVFEPIFDFPMLDILLTGMWKKDTVTKNYVDVGFRFKK
jgi:hypothetical protein